MVDVTQTRLFPFEVVDPPPMEEVKYETLRDFVFWMHFQERDHLDTLWRRFHAEMQEVGR